MFGLFKNKVKLKNENCIMTSVYSKKGVKIDSELIVPEGFECLVFNNCKHYFSLPSGKHTLNKQLLEPLITNQQKRTKRLKYIKLVSHYVNLSKQKLELKYKKQKFVVEFCITDSLKFAELMLIYSYKIDGDYANDYINEIFYELLQYVKGNYKQISAEILSNYGLTINSFEPTVNNKVSIFSQQTVNNEQESSPQHNESIFIDKPDINEIQSTSSTSLTPSLNDLNISSASTNTKLQACPKCGNVAKFKTTFCLKCGQKLNDE